MARDKEQEERTKKVAVAITRKLKHSVAAKPDSEPSITTDGSVIFMTVNNNTGHRYMIRVSEYS